jgi:hypothetical protein
MQRHARLVYSRVGRESEGEWCLTGVGGLVPGKHVGGDCREGEHRISRPAAPGTWRQ